MALPNITTKIINSDDYNERKILASDVNQIKQAIQTGVLDIKPSDIHMEGNVITADGGQNWIRRSGNKFQYYDAGTWKEITEATNTATFTAGENIAIRDVVYLKVSDGKIYKASNTNYDWIGVAKEAITNASTGEVYLNNSVIGGFTGLTRGAWYGLSDTPGKIVSNPRDVGIALSATQIILIKNNYRENNLMTYAILYNRMENDAQATAPQLNANIQSDLFCCAAGKYSTVCTAETTSLFSTNLYIGENSNSTYAYTTNCCILCCYSTCPSVNFSFTNSSGVSSISTSKSYVNACGIYCLSKNNTILNISDFDCFRFNVCANATYASNACGSCVILSSNICVNEFNCLINFSKQGGTCSGTAYSCNFCFEYKKICNNCYGYYINNSFICNISNPILNYIICNCNLLSTYTDCTTSTYNCLNLSTTAITKNTIITTTLKNYATPKNAVILVTNSVLPAGNCIRYDIKNQAGCTYVSDAEPDKIYNLCASDSCCFYAVIKQCIGCSLCTPQCMTQYALMYM